MVLQGQRTSTNHIKLSVTAPTWADALSSWTCFQSCDQVLDELSPLASDAGDDNTDDAESPHDNCAVVTMLLMSSLEISPSHDQDQDRVLVSVRHRPGVMSSPDCTPPPPPPPSPSCLHLHFHPPYTCTQTMVHG